MINMIGDVALKLASVVAAHNPKYPLYIPVDIADKEWVLRYGGFVSDEGFYLEDEDTNTIRYFDDIYHLMGFLSFDSIIDWEQLDERITIAAMSVSALLKTNEEQIDHVFGEDFAKNAVPIRTALEDAYLSHPEKNKAEVKIEYLTKMMEVPKEETGPTKLHVVKKEDT